MNKILVTAFEPFGGEGINPAMLALEALEEEDVIKLLLPVEYETAAQKAIEAIRECSPAAVVSLGQAGGRDAVTPERYAVNLRHSPSPDNAGRVCDHEKIVRDGPEKLASSFSAEEICAALTKAGFPARVSDSAGTFVCNDVMYSVLRALQDTGIPAGFIHVPYCTAQLKNHPDCFGMDEDEIARAVETALADLRRRLPGAV